MGQGRTLSPLHGYACTGPWTDDDDIVTRLGRETRTIRLARIEGDRIVPWADDEDERRAWAMSEARCDARWLAGDLIPDGLDGESAKGSWTRFHKQFLPLVVVLDDGSTTGNLSYSPVTGLEQA